MTREEIKTLRKSQKLSQAELGKRSNLTASEISRIECGYKDATELEAAAIAAALGVTGKVGAGLAKSGGLETKPVANTEPSAPPAAQPSTAVAGKAAPSGTDLNDPTNFGVLPDLKILERGALDAAAFRARLAAEITRANAILHTPRVPAAVWRAWRQFEQQGAALLRGDIAPVNPAPIARPAPVAPVPAREKQASPVPDAKLESKSFNSLFAETARETLAPELVARLNQAAEAARQSDPSVGFMKHFRRIAENELDAVALKQVTAEANVRLASADRSRARRGRGRSADAS